MIDIKVTGRVPDKLNALARAGKNLKSAMRDIAQALEVGIGDAFSQEQDPVSGDPWAALSDNTKEARRKKRKWPGQKLVISARLLNSMTSAYYSDEAIAGTNLIYAPTHQFGAKAGEFGSTRRGQPIPFGDIPARPFLGMSDDTQEEILDIINQHFHDALRA